MVSAATFLAVVGVFQRMRKGDVVKLALWVELVEFVGGVGVGAEEGSEEVK